MKQEILEKINLLKYNLSIDNNYQLQDLLYIIYLNDTILENKDPDINYAIDNILTNVIYSTLSSKQNSSNLLSNYISNRLIKGLK